MAITIKSHSEIEKMREAGKILADVHDRLGEIIEPGISTLDIDRKGEEMIRKAGCIPSFLNYEGYPASICVSVNDEVVHGIPNKKNILKEGDIVSLDAGVIYEGYHSDAARTYGVGQISDEDQRLIDITRESFFEGIKLATAGNHLHDISQAIQKYVEDAGFSVVRDLVGHGIGSNLHEEPQIPNFKTVGRGPKLREGMTLAIEPMVNIGDWKVWILEDDWTVVTRDGSKSAHYENTILITDKEPEILSLTAK
ncbi:type I methionyl aminopeptidase [Eubacterium xylanophilum]|uniref:type I methionyl aminopeptidase n=1 Tax=Eubacterium xylanophilum TaxID=39497 RepID=UPI00047CE1FE|nr:type I methionyl aminopeptidase [Eubacterium xylanophilum]